MAASMPADGHWVATRRFVCAVLAAAFTAAGSFALPAPAVADEPLPPATPGPPPEAAEPPPGVVLAPPGADEAGRRQAQAELKVTETALKKAVAAEKALAKRLPALQKRQAELYVQLVHLAEQDKAAAEALTAAHDRVRRMAVAGYVIGGDVPPVDYLLRSKDPSDFVRRSSLVRNATEAKADALDGYEAAKNAASDALLEAMKESDRVGAAIANFDSEMAVAKQRVAELYVEVGNRRQLLDVLTAAAPVGTSDIPRLFLDAYRRAATTMQRKVPHCRVQWTAIAAIGKIESNHGRYRGAQLALNGDVYPRIIGLPLDGTRGTRLIKDTDGGKLDLDPVFDHAVGPMQFIPSTWSRIAVDGNGDGVSDANNAYDAALGTAAYLCRAVPAGALDTEEPLRRAFFSYNHSESYVETVFGWATTFNDLSATL